MLISNGVILMELNDFANRCGYFQNAFLAQGISYNNGYNCLHPGQGEQYTDEENGATVGACFSWSCPLGFPPDAEDLVKRGVITEEEATRDYRYDESELDMIIVTDVEMIKKLKEAHHA